jgi:hypothetical protein
VSDIRSRRACILAADRRRRGWRFYSYERLHPEGASGRRETAGPVLPALLLFDELTMPQRYAGVMAVRDLVHDRPSARLLTAAQVSTRVSAA